MIWRFTRFHLLTMLVLVWLDSQVHRSMGSLEIHRPQRVDPSALHSHGELDKFKILTAQSEQIKMFSNCKAAGFWTLVSSLLQPPTRSLCLLVTWTTSTTRSCVLPSLTCTSWPIFSGIWISRWFPWLTSTGRRCTVLWQNSSCCSTRGFMVSPPERSRRQCTWALWLQPLAKTLGCTFKFCGTCLEGWPVSKNVPNSDLGFLTSERFCF